SWPVGRVGGVPTATPSPRSGTRGDGGPPGRGPAREPPGTPWPRSGGTSVTAPRPRDGDRVPLPGRSSRPLLSLSVVCGRGNAARRGRSRPPPGRPAAPLVPSRQVLARYATAE